LWLRYGFVNFYYEIILGATILFPVSIALITIGKNKDPGYDVNHE
jgi:hypothetical protein